MLRAERLNRWAAARARAALVRRGQRTKSVNQNCLANRWCDSRRFARRRHWACRALGRRNWRDWAAADLLVAAWCRLRVTCRCLDVRRPEQGSTDGVA